ncbi:DMT family transporter [Sphaerisporangium fuscum]|uniref:DMT family transporter n=1 Tax=Sphaerisporangium fuscum TaxID=2835868 RepID=UPI001BDC4D75|nr:EamA family transporter [Sphaerisporangium fuscum]
MRTRIDDSAHLLNSGTTSSHPPRRPWTRGRLVAAGLPVVFVLIWSSGYLAGTIGARSGASMALLAWRFVIATAVVGIVALLTRAPWPREPRVYLHLLVTGVLLQTVQLGAVYFGLGQGVPAGLSSLILSACPLIVAAVAVPLFSERLQPRQWAGLALGLAGVAVSLGEKLSGGGRLTGYAFTGLALAGLAAGTLYQKKFGQSVDLRTGTTIQLLGATATTLPLAIAHGGLGMPLTVPALGSLAWLAIVNSIGAFTLLFVLLRRRPAGAATSLLYLVPPVTALLAVPILGQKPSASIFLGMVISGIGVTLVLTARRSTTP